MVWPTVGSRTAKEQNRTTLVCVCRSFSDINVPQGSVATRMRCGEIFNKHFTANLLENQPVTEF